MSDEPLRQPRTFWQWLTNQPGAIFVPPPAPIVRVNPPRTALDIIEEELQRIHSEMNSFSSGSGAGYQGLLKKLDLLHTELIRRSKEESGNGQAGV
jgi:hypothetical protein